MANHGVDEGILDAVPRERGNIGIARGGSRDGTDAKLRTNALHTFADLAVEVVDAALNVGFRLGSEKDLREDPFAHLGFTAVLVEHLLQRLDDGDMDDDLGSVGNLATDIGQLLVILIIEVVVAPFQMGKVFQV